jgi:hypothetical protein
MQKLLWSTGLLISIVLAQPEYNILSENSPVLFQSGVLPADSSVKIIIEPSDLIATDVLQESLYVQILAEIKNPTRGIYTAPPENKFQLLQRCLDYYPKAVLQGDTLIIPYPPHKVERFKEVRYFIPINYFNTNSKIHSLQPQIQLHLNPDKSTLMINNSYLLSFYRSPRIKNKSLHQCKKVLQYIFNLLIPYMNKNELGTEFNNRAVVHYKGYTEHEINLESEKKFYAFWESLCGQGSLYFFPSKVDDLEKRIIVHGLLYVMKDDILDAYHFGDLTVIYSEQDKGARYELQLDFYPFIINSQMNN